MIAGLPRMLTDIVSAIITSQEDFELAGEAASTAGLAVMAKDAAADVVVLGSPPASETSNYVDVLYARPEMNRHNRQRWRAGGSA